MLPPRYIRTTPTTASSLPAIAAPTYRRCLKVRTYPNGDSPKGGYFNHFYLRSDQWAYVADNRGIDRQLYDLTLDPSELNNVARDQLDAQEELHPRALETMGGLPPYYQGEAVAPIKR